MARKPDKYIDIVKLPGRKWKRVRWNGKYVHDSRTSRRIRDIARRNGWSYRRKKVLPAKRLRVVSRKSWGGGPRTRPVVHWPKTADVWVHHTVGVGNGAEYMQQMQSDHKAKGWGDIGYNFVIFPDGKVYEGAGYGRRGAHNPGHNHEPGIAFVGNFMKQVPTRSALAAFSRLRSALGLTGKVRFHRETYPTDCPGDSLIAAIRKMVS